MRKLHGKSGSVDTSMLNEQRKQLAEIIQEFNTRDVFNMDETGLYFSMDFNVKDFEAKRKI